MRYIIGQAGIVVNVLEGPSKPEVPGFDVLIDASGVAFVGAAYDPKDIKLTDADQVALTMLFRHENLIRELIRAVRTNAGINTAANTAGLPTAANSADVTKQQFNDYVKTQLS